MTQKMEERDKAYAEANKCTKEVDEVLELVSTQDIKLKQYKKQLRDLGKEVRQRSAQDIVYKTGFSGFFFILSEMVLLLLLENNFTCLEI